MKEFEPDVSFVLSEFEDLEPLEDVNEIPRSSHADVEMIDESQGTEALAREERKVA